MLILDESTANLDPDTEADILDRLLSHRRGKTTILISHHPEVIQRADWIVLLDDGRLQFGGAIEDFRMSQHTTIKPPKRAEYAAQMSAA